MKKVLVLLTVVTLLFAGCGGTSDTTAPVSDEVVTLRIANSEEYIDEGHFSEVDAMRTLLACADHPEDSDVQTLLALWRETNGIIDRRTHP